MGSTGITYRAALRITLRRTSAAYGYTLTIATTVAALTATRGKPAGVELCLFVFGGIAAFAALDGCLQAFPVEEDKTKPRTCRGFEAVELGGLEPPTSWVRCSDTSARTLAKR